MDNLHIFLGATVADAAARPLHWVYDAKKLDQYIELFSKEFKLSLSLKSSISIKEKGLNCKNFNDFLINLDNFQLSCIYKLSSFTKSASSLTL